MTDSDANTSTQTEKAASLEPDSGPAARPSATVLITACEDSPALRECLAEIRSQAHAIGAEVLLVMNVPRSRLSSDSLAALGRSTDCMLFVETPGKSSALNEGIETIESPVVAFTDDDAVPRPGWLAALIAPLVDPGRSENLVGTGGRVQPSYPDGGAPSWYLEMVAAKPQSVLGPKHDFGDVRRSYTAKTGFACAPIGANCAYRREVFDRVRYAEDLGPNHATGLKGGEDTELALRLLLDGFALEYIPEAVVEHPVHSERLGLDYCRPRFYSHGIELFRLRQRLGVAAKSCLRLRWEHRVYPGLNLLLPFARGWSRERIELQREKMRGMLDEAERSARGSTRAGPS